MISRFLFFNRLLFLIFFTLLTINSSVVQAQLPPVASESGGLNKENKENLNESTDSSSDLDGSAEEKNGILPNDIDISDAIPIGSFIDGWQDKYEDISASLGLDDSILSRLISTALILIVFLILVYFDKKITSVVRHRLEPFTKKYSLSHRKVTFYQRSFYSFFLVLLFLIMLSALAVTWDIHITNYLSKDFIVSILSNTLTVFLLVIGAVVIVDIICGLIETSFTHWSSASQARVDTLLPIAKTTVYVTFFTIFALVLLAELGLNVMPLLAGAGVLGFAIGFGAQTIIKDLLTGFIIILEDLIQVGDVVTLADRTGQIERITIRKVQLRDLSGSVFTIPYSEISIVENLTKEYSYAMFEIGIAYRENVDEINKLLVQIDEGLRKDENFNEDILEPLEIFGLDKFGDSAVVIKARIKTRPIKQWRITREFNRRMKHIFDENNVEIPFPHQTIYFGEDKEGKAPALQVRQEVSGVSKSDSKRNIDKSSTIPGSSADNAIDGTDPSQTSAGEKKVKDYPAEPGQESSQDKNRKGSLPKLPDNGVDNEVDD